MKKRQGCLLSLRAKRPSIGWIPTKSCLCLGWKWRYCCKDSRRYAWDVSSNCPTCWSIHLAQAWIIQSICIGGLQKETIPRIISWVERGWCQALIVLSKTAVCIRRVDLNCGPISDKIAKIPQSMSLLRLIRLLFEQYTMAPAQSYRADGRQYSTSSTYWIQWSFRVILPSSVY